MSCCTSTTALMLLAERLDDRKEEEDAIVTVSGADVATVRWVLLQVDSVADAEVAASVCKRI